MSEQSVSVQIGQRVRWLPADMDTPISLFMGMAQGKPGILLESAEVDGRWGRYSVLACDMALYLICREGRLECPHCPLEGLLRQQAAAAERQQ